MPSAFTRWGSMKPGPITSPNNWRQGIGFVDNVTPVGAIDGVNKTYTLVNSTGTAKAPNPTESLMLMADGNLCVQNGPATDPSGNPMFTYTLSGSTVTFNNALPSTVVTLKAWFRYKVGS